MATKGMLKAIDEEIARLQQARTLLLGSEAATEAPAAKKSKIQTKAKTGRAPMSAEARERIAAAQRKRWAVSKRAAKKAARAAAK